MMKKKTLPTLLLVVFLLQMAQLPALAMEIVISSNGTMSFYNDQVLGREDDRERNEGSRSERDEKDREQAREQDDREKEDARETRKSVREDKDEYVRDEKPSRTVPRTSNTKLRVSSEKEKVEVKLEDKREKPADGVDAIDFRTEERTSTERLRLETSAELRDDLRERREEGAEERTERRSESAEKAREERRERTEEKIEIRSERREDGTQEFQFESRNVRANLKGAEFVLDPETNEVTVVTPSGEEKVLSHLPDQVITKMQEKGLFDSVEGVNPEEVELELETREDGSVVYSTTVEREKKLLGFFTRKVRTKLEMDDETGEVRETELPRESFLGRLLGL